MTTHRMLFICVAIGCARERKEPTPPDPTPPSLPATAPRSFLVFGDCADAKAWVSGPRPMAFEQGDPKRPWSPRDIDDADGEDPGDDADLFETMFPNDGPAFTGGLRDPSPATWRIDLRTAEGEQTKQHFRTRGGYEGELTRCYADRAAVVPGLKGTLIVDIRVSNAATAVVKATGFDAVVGECVAKRMTSFFANEPPGRLELAITFWKRGERSPDDLSTARGLFRYPRDVAGDYTPGANALRVKAAALESCLRNQVGAAVVDLSTATVYGIEDATASACIAAVAKQIGSRTRCAFAYGEMPLSELATLEIADTTITIDGEQPETMYELMRAVAKRAVRDDAQVLAVRSPLLVKPSDPTPASFVIRAIGYVVRAGDDVVLATKRGAEWKTLGRVVLPSPPVPLGTGGHWAPYKPRGNAKPTRETLSVLVGPRDVWLMNSKTKVVTKRPPGQATQLLRMARNQFTRDDIEIGVLQSVTWASLVEVIDAAESVGFDRWQLVDHEALGEPSEE